jgi:hypothetical protein
MKRKSKILPIMLWLFLIPVLTTKGQDVCKGHIEKIIGAKGSTYLVPCHDMVILDIETYSKYRYMEKQFHIMDSTVSGYTTKLDSLDKESARNQELLEEKVKDKDGIIDKYKKNSQEIAAVLEKCKEDSEGFAKVYQIKVEENRALDKKVEKLKHQRKGILGIAGGLAGALLLVLLL